MKNHWLQKAPLDYSATWVNNVIQSLYKSTSLFTPLICVYLIFFTMVTVVKAQQFTVLKSFGAISQNYTNFDGAFPRADLTLSGNTLYGTTWLGGDGGGTVFKINADGSGYIVLKNFSSVLYPLPPTNSGGASPTSHLTLSSNTLYGTTYKGGNFGMGTVFKVNTDGTGFTVLYNFTNRIAYTNNCAGLVLSGDTLYGTTEGPTTSDLFPPANGTVFKINTDGTGYAVLKNFSHVNSDGAGPQAALTLSGTNLFGTTTQGGSFNRGTIFRMNTDGTGFTVLKNFTTLEGACPCANLTLSDGTLYGTTTAGSSMGSLFQINTDGTGFTVLRKFQFHGENGSFPDAGLTLFGNILYGTTANGGATNSGVIFSLNLAPILTSQLQNTQVSLQFTGTPNYNYTLQSATNLTPPVNWQTIITNPTDAGGNWQFTDTNLASLPKFYRAVRQ